MSQRVLHKDTAVFSLGQRRISQALLILSAYLLPPLQGTLSQMTIGFLPPFYPLYSSPPAACVFGLFPPLIAFTSAHFPSTPSHFHIFFIPISTPPQTLYLSPHTSPLPLPYSTSFHYMIFIALYLSYSPQSNSPSVLFPTRYIPLPISFLSLT